MKEILAWSVVIPSVITLALGGFGVLTLPKRPEYRIAQGTFAVAAVYFSTTMVFWGITTTHGVLVRLPVIVLSVGFAAWLLMEGVRIVEHRKHDDEQLQQSTTREQTETTTPSPVSRPSSPPTPSLSPSTPSKPDNKQSKAAEARRRREQLLRDLHDPNNP